MTTTTPALTVNDLFSFGDLELALQDGYVREQNHPTLPLKILNYTEKAAYEGAWNPVTLTCRGLIVHIATMEVVARPFRKFFNHGQAGAPDLDLGGEVVVTDKQDGSLGILYPVPGGHAIATRGSFASEQALHATQVWNARYADRFTPDPRLTYLFEIIYPTNRIVCDYGDLDDLVMLGAIDTITGFDRSTSARAGWPGPATERFPYATLAEALAAEPRPNAEGLVVHFVASGERLKLKQADYVALHRIVTGLTARTVWQWLIEGKPLDDLIAPLPDEFHPWVQQVAAGIETKVRSEVWRLKEEYTKIRDVMPDSWRADTREGRATFAKLAAPHPDKWAMFLLLDGRDVRPELLKRADPGPYITPSGRTYGEDTA